MVEPQKEKQPTGPDEAPASYHQADTNTSASARAADTTSADAQNALLENDHHQTYSPINPIKDSNQVPTTFLDNSHGSNEASTTIRVDLARHSLQQAAFPSLPALPNVPASGAGPQQLEQARAGQEQLAGHRIRPPPNLHVPGSNALQLIRRQYADIRAYENLPRRENAESPASKGSERRTSRARAQSPLAYSSVPAQVRMPGTTADPQLIHKPNFTQDQHFMASESSVEPERGRSRTVRPVPGNEG